MTILSSSGGERVERWVQADFLGHDAAAGLGIEARELGQESRPPNWKLSPSDFAFLWEYCKRCFHLKVARQFGPPRTPFPGIFGVIDKLMNEFFNGLSSSEVDPSLPPGTVAYGESWVESEPITIPGHTSTCFLRGKFDSVIRFEDGSYGVIDFKTTNTRGHHLPLYSRQLHAYAYALENAAPGKLALSPVTRLGLVCVQPMDISRDAEGRISYIGEVRWIEFNRDDDGFMRFLGEVMDVLELPEPPEASPSCALCKYRDDARRTQL